MRGDIRIRPGDGVTGLDRHRARVEPEGRNGDVGRQRLRGNDTRERNCEQQKDLLHVDPLSSRANADGVSANLELRLLLSRTDRSRPSYERMSSSTQIAAGANGDAYRQFRRW